MNSGDDPGLNPSASGALQIALQSERREHAETQRQLEKISRELLNARRALAYEASVLESYLALATFPKGRRKGAQEQIRRMRLAAAGKPELAYSGPITRLLEEALIETTDVVNRGEVHPLTSSW